MLSVEECLDIHDERLVVGRWRVGQVLALGLDALELSPRIVDGDCHVVTWIGAWADRLAPCVRSSGVLSAVWACVIHAFDPDSASTMGALPW